MRSGTARPKCPTWNESAPAPLPAPALLGTFSEYLVIYFALVNIVERLATRPGQRNSLGAPLVTQFECSFIRPVLNGNITIENREHVENSSMNRHFDHLSDPLPV
jgi:hypothetical protein